MKVFLHVQHLLGIGHLKRAAILCGALADAGFEVTLASGGAPVPGVVPGRVNLVQLPPMAAADATFKTLVDQGGEPVTDDWKARRAAALLAAWRQAKAEVLIGELFPFGRRVEIQIERTPFDFHIMFLLQPLDHTLADITPRSDVIGENSQFERSHTVR